MVQSDQQSLSKQYRTNFYTVNSSRKELLKSETQRLTLTT